MTSPSQTSADQPDQEAAGQADKEFEQTNQRSNGMSPRARKIARLTAVYIVTLGAFVALLAVFRPGTSTTVDDTEANRTLLSEGSSISQCEISEAGTGSAIIEVTNPFQDVLMFIGIEVFFTDGDFVVGSADAELQDLDVGESASSEVTVQVPDELTTVSCEVASVSFA